MSETRVSQSLNLSEPVNTATILPEDLRRALWLLSTPEPPTTVVLPSSLVVRRRLARAGLVFAADRRGIPLEIEGETVPVHTALGVGAVVKPLGFELFDLETSDRMRVMSRLEGREPPRPDPYGRRYYWMDSLGAAPSGESQEYFERHSDQCLFEFVDNVYRWSGAQRALVVVSATSGGGSESHNRLHIVVADDGVGILGSVCKKAESLAAHGERTTCLSEGAKPNYKIAAGVVADILVSSFGERSVIGARGGHGLSTVAKHAAEWNGTMNVISTFAPGQGTQHGRHGRAGKWDDEEFKHEGMQGTLVHLTLDATMHDSPGSRVSNRCEPVPA
ncbi:MAG: hypothetical protein OXB92_14770 [Acidimicrobiaceae bacterium]|nr:hypothetical protein [Acidimicrobiia bacterium]MCY4495108.1 hypothetical protein [Acidimicrobiaceae bacterium]